MSSDRSDCMSNTDGIKATVLNDSGTCCIMVFAGFY